MDTAHVPLETGSSMSRRKSSRSQARFRSWLRKPALLAFAFLLVAAVGGALTQPARAQIGPPPPPPTPPAQPYGQQNVPPATPINLQATQVQPNAVTFTWSPGSGYTAGYWI